MARFITVTRLKEIRKGWSYRAHYFQLVLNGSLLGRIKDGETITFRISGEEQLLEIWPLVPGSRRTQWCAIIPGGEEDYHISVSPFNGIEPIVEPLSAASFPELSRMPYPPFFRNLAVDDLVGLENCYLVRPNGDMDRLIDSKLTEKCEKLENRNEGAAPEQACDCVDAELILILTDEGQTEWGKDGENKLQRCLNPGIWLMLDLGDGYYQDLTTGEFFVLHIGETWVGSPDIPYVHGKLVWKQITSIPSDAGENMRHIPDDQQTGNAEPALKEST